MRDLFTRSAVLLASVICCSQLANARPPQTYTINFDGTGAEAGVTGPGTGDFQIFGTTWTGGRIIAPQPKYSASGVAALEIFPFAQVTFDVPISKATFFFVFNENAGPLNRARAIPFTASGIKFGHTYSAQPSFHNDPTRFLTLQRTEPIVRIDFIGNSVPFIPNGYLDSFTFTTVPAPGGAAALAVAGSIGLGRRQRRRS